MVDVYAHDNGHDDSCDEQEEPDNLGEHELALAELGEAADGGELEEPLAKAVFLLHFILLVFLQLRLLNHCHLESLEWFRPNTMNSAVGL